MSIPQKDLKLLWGRSGNRCAICRCALSFDTEHSSAAHPVGEQAHIVARESDGPRGQSILTVDERDTYANLILLCPTDHEKIDKAIGDYPVERLHQLKTDHELWVQTQLAGGDRKNDAADMVYTHLVDDFVDSCKANCWESWASSAVEIEPIWESDLLSGIGEFEVAVESAVWPGRHAELERALKTVAAVLRVARDTLLLHAELEGDVFRGPKFYKELREWNQERYDELFDEWRAWQNTAQALVFEATRAANWLADSVREALNPAFFLIEGRFRIRASVMSDLPGGLWAPEYTPEERAALPDALSERLANPVALFPFKLREE